MANWIQNPDCCLECRQGCGAERKSNIGRGLFGRLLLDIYLNATRDSITFASCAVN
jgi:hypothetical protein